MRTTMKALAIAGAALFAQQAAAQGAAITKQISPLDVKDPALVELTTLYKLPSELRFKSLTTPQGITFKGVDVQDCAAATAVGDSCRQRFGFKLDAVSNNGPCRLNGNYVAKFDIICRAGLPAGTCTPGTRDIAFSLQSENFCAYATVDTSKKWDQLKGKDIVASDIGIGETPSLWFLGKPVRGGFETISLDTDRAVGMRRGGGAVRVDVGAAGVPWVVNDVGDVYSYTYSGTGRWDRTDPLPGGRAVDVGVSAKGVVWVVGGATVPGGYAIHRRNGTVTQGKWETLPGGAMRVDVDAGGLPWVVNNNGDIFRRIGNDWQIISSGIKAKDIGVGANGSVWVVGTDGMAYKLNADGRTWSNRGGSAFVNITVQADGVPIATNANQEVWVGQP